jgi:5-methyltetrahydropteroyltriglutamate--homocysteine methyltransferase
MPIPTEPIGSIPRPPEFLAAMRARVTGRISEEQFRASEDVALRETIQRMEATGSPVITDGEQTKPSFATYPLTGVANLAPDGVMIAFADGHTRQLPRLTAGPFRYGVHAVSFLKAAQRQRTPTDKTSRHISLGTQPLLSSKRFERIWEGSISGRSGYRSEA